MTKLNGNLSLERLEKVVLIGLEWLRYWLLAAMLIQQKH